jgi:trigger factor
LIEKEIDYMLLNLINDLQLQGITLDDYLKERNMSIDACRDEFRPQAMDRLKKSLILDSIAQKENIKVEDQEYESWVKSNFKTQPTKMEKYLKDDTQKAYLKEELRIQKTLNFLLEVADIKK